jgi:hypothetical protein
MGNTDAPRVGIEVNFRGDARVDAERVAAALNGPNKDAGVKLTGDEGTLELGAGTILVVLVASALGKAGLKVAIDRLRDWAKEHSKELEAKDSLKVTVQIEQKGTIGRAANLILRRSAVDGMLVLLQVADDVVKKM